MTWIRWFVLVVGLSAVVIVGLAAFGAMRWERRSRALLVRLEAARARGPVTRYDPRELDGLPPVVQRYFRLALSDGQAIITAVDLAHRGTFNQSATAERWAPFTSVQRVVTRRPGFVWDASIAMFPGVPVRVHDAYVAGEGILDASVGGLVGVAHLRGPGEIALGEFMRWVAESAWYPTALLPSQGVTWEGINGHFARATLSDGDLRVALTYRFGDDGLIESVRAESRGRTVGDRVEPLPWECRLWDYELRDGMMVPLEGKVSWVLPDGPRPYWNGTITSIRYEFAP